jgi:hypothetical protein
VTAREKELEALLKEVAPAIRDVLWCALVWNDHNFTEADLHRKLELARQRLGYHSRGEGVERFNAWMQRVDAALIGVPT